MHTLYGQLTGAHSGFNEYRVYWEGYLIGRGAKEQKTIFLSFLQTLLSDSKVRHIGEIPCSRREAGESWKHS